MCVFQMSRITRAAESSSHKFTICFVSFQARAKELEGLQPRVEELLSQVQSMEGAKGWFERRLKEAEVSIC